MDTVVRQFLEQLVLGEEMRCDGLSVVPIVSGFQATLDYIALQTAIGTHAVRVEEVTESGSVGHLLVTNTGETSVLALDGEELAGAKQNRILNTTILLGRHTRTVIPVSCTEQGRWSYTSVEFKSSNAFAPPRIRENAKRAVNQSLAENKGFRANQCQVWDQVSRLSAAAGIHSPTGALNDVVNSRLPQLNRIVAGVPVMPEQCGLLAIAGGHVLGFDVVSRPGVYASLHERLLRSYILETGAMTSAVPDADSARTADEFLHAAFVADERLFPSVGIGDDYRYSGPDIVGSALAAEGQVVHLAFFRVPPGEGTEWTPGLTSYRTRMGFRSEAPYHAESDAGGA
jgi:hypothetical protein